jgi:hypothetical protein
VEVFEPAATRGASELLPNDSWPSLYSIGTDSTENTTYYSSFVGECVSVAAITQQRSLFAELLLRNGCNMADYFAVVA